ncbi:hypothetical protein PsAD2_02530 [Pseudovibrio axinellae]|uniref:Uncharacterized protein n=1 Tax=Pseudovibrio axinellae TaxID=989403 RepID=A0A165YNB3_9HYPH|nr:hypothetical protein [Pseudovibrio axinellae]KZL19011.1 hypothetical protein PsAD2_02530 [Pseudovibrio axinellae]SEP83975.1 hypothetical protein SAMN05421798_101511 [Pseudovibrio axinellae]
MIFRWLFRRLFFFRILTFFGLWGVYLALIQWARKGLYCGLGAGLLMSGLTLVYGLAIYWSVAWLRLHTEGYVVVEVFCWVLWVPILWFAAVDTELYIVCARAPNQPVLGNLLSTQRYEEKFKERLAWIKRQIK